MDVRAYLGIDPSLTKTGLALIIDNSGLLETRITEIPAKNLRGTDRLRHIRDEVVRFIEGLPLVFAAQESAAFYAVNRADALGQLRGTLLVFLQDRNIPIIEIPPTQLKKFATRSGGASKEQMQAAALDMWNRKMTNDEADAAWLSFVAYAHFSPGPLHALTRAQIEVLKSLRTPPTLKTHIRTARKLNI